MKIAAQDLAGAGVSFEEIRSFYDAYIEALDDGRLHEWPDFFRDDCRYQIIPRENFEKRYTLCTMQADSKAMLVDRVQGITKTQMYSPRYCRRFCSGLRVSGVEGSAIVLRQNVLAVQTLLDRPSQIILCGVSHDRLVCENGELLIQERIVVSDTEMIANSLIFPV